MIGGVAADDTMFGVPRFGDFWEDGGTIPTDSELRVRMHGNGRTETNSNSDADVLDDDGFDGQFLCRDRGDGGGEANNYEEERFGHEPEKEEGPKKGLGTGAGQDSVGESQKDGSIETQDM